METAEAEGGLTRQLCQEHAKTTKALENDSYESNTEAMMYIAVVAPGVPRLNCMGKKLHPED